MKILVIATQDDSVRDMLKFRQEHIDKIKNILPTVEISIAENQDTLEKNLADTDILIADIIVGEFPFKAKNAPKLQWIHIMSAGIDRLPEDIKNSNILITNSSGVHPIPIAEHVMTYMLMFARQFTVSYRNQIQKKWERTDKTLHVFELRGKTIGIVGLGRVGSEIAKTAKNMGMQVTALVRNKKQENSIDTIYDFNNTQQFLQSADIVVNALPLTSETHHLFDAKKFTMMKKTAYFINIGRGKIVHEVDLIAALKNGIIAGAGLDVFEEEPLPSSSELWNLDTVILTPHYAGWTPQYMERLTDIFIENLNAYLFHKKMPNLIDKKRGY